MSDLTYKTHDRDDNEFIVDKDTLEQVKYLASCGLKNYEISGALGISSGTFYNKCSEYPEFRKALDWGRSYSVKRVVEKLFELATMGNVKAIEVYLGKVRRHMPIHYSERTQKVLKDKKSEPQDKIEALLLDHIDGYITLDIVSEMSKILDTLYTAKKLSELEKKLEEITR